MGEPAVYRIEPIPEPSSRTSVTILVQGTTIMNVGSAKYEKTAES